jgi:hypothetical protein
MRCCGHLEDGATPKDAKTTSQAKGYQRTFTNIKLCSQFAQITCLRCRGTAGTFFALLRNFPLRSSIGVLFDICL